VCNKTLKDRPNFPEGFGSMQDARADGQAFFPWYNTEHRQSSLGLLTPHDAHYGHAGQHIAARGTVLATAYPAPPSAFPVGRLSHRRGPRKCGSSLGCPDSY
jgi:putative transposase